MSDPRTLGQRIQDAMRKQMPSLRLPPPIPTTLPINQMRRELGMPPFPGTAAYEVELLGRCVTAFGQMSPAEQRRALNYLNDRYGDSS
jgi:hypothetical protein